MPEVSTVSIIIPNYNHALYLQRRIDTVLGQEGVEIEEILILDDCSKDNSLEVIEGYLHIPKVRFLKNDTNSGSTFKQWAKGIGLAKGKYIWIAESDDYSEASFLKSLVEVLDKNETAGLAFCQSVQVDTNEKPISSHDFLPSKWQDSFVQKGSEIVYKNLFRENCIPNVSSLVFRRSVLEGIDNDYTNYRLSGDWFFYVKVLQRSDLCFVAKPLNYFRIHANTVRQGTHRSALTLREHLQIFGEIKQGELPSTYCILKAAKAFSARFAIYSSSLPFKEIVNIWRLAFKKWGFFSIFLPYWFLQTIKFRIKS
jgi:glycosyltransferase involved in cell wall biosynthesis